MIMITVNVTGTRTDLRCGLRPGPTTSLSWSRALRPAWNVGLSALFYNIINTIIGNIFDLYCIEKHLPNVNIINCLLQQIIETVLLLLGVQLVIKRCLSTMLSYHLTKRRYICYCFSKWHFSFRTHAKSALSFIYLHCIFFSSVYFKTSTKNDVIVFSNGLYFQVLY